MTATVWKRAAMIVVAVALWMLLAPTSAGGSLDYVTVQGTSMQPTFYTNDLVLVSKRSSYHLGDIIAYHAPNLGGAVVIHRVIGFDGDRFITKGDNNNFIDVYHPADSDIVGAKAMKIGAGAKIVSRLHQRTTFAVLLAATAFTFFWNIKPYARRRSRHTLRGHRA